MTYYGYIHNTISIINDKTMIKNIHQFKYISEAFLSINHRKLPSLDKLMFWKSFHVMSFLAGKRPKMMILVFARAYKDTIYTVMIFADFHKYQFMIYLFNLIFFVRLTVEILVFDYSNRYSINFRTTDFIDDYIFSGELYNWRHPINIHIFFHTDYQQSSNSVYKHMLLSSLRFGGDS